MTRKEEARFVYTLSTSFIQGSKCLFSVYITVFVSCGHED